MKNLIAFVVGVVLLVESTSATAQNPMTHLPPGTVVQDSKSAPTGGFNRVILLARPRIASGDTGKLSGLIQVAVSSMTLTIMASVGSEDQVAGTFRLHDVGIGYSVPIESKLVVVDPESARRLGASLDFAQRTILGRNQEQLDAVRVVARTSTLMIFDAPAIYYRGGMHRDFVARHLVWTETATGRLMMANWLLVERADGRLVPSDEPLRFLSAGTREDRAIHVDGSEFIFSAIPTERAFAVERLPPGRDVPWSGAMKETAVSRSYGTEQLGDLVRALNEATNEHTDNR